MARVSLPDLATQGGLSLLVPSSFGGSSNTFLSNRPAGITNFKILLELNREVTSKTR